MWVVKRTTFRRDHSGPKCNPSVKVPVLLSVSPETMKGKLDWTYGVTPRSFLYGWHGLNGQANGFVDGVER